LASQTGYIHKEKSIKEEYTAELARKIGIHLLRKLKKNLRKHLRIQLESFNSIPDTNDENTEIGSPTDTERENLFAEKKRSAYVQLKSLVLEEKTLISTKPQKFFDILGELTALLIICKEQKLKNLEAFEEELLTAICYAPSYCLTKEIMSAGTFCWNWISTIPEFSAESLYRNLSYSLLLSLNSGGIFETKSVQSNFLFTDRKKMSPMLESSEIKGFPDIFKQQIELFASQVAPKIRSDRLSTLTYDEISCNFSREETLEGLCIWLKFIMNQLKNIIGKNTRDLLVIYKMVKNLMDLPLTTKSKKCALDLQVRFRIFNLALLLLNMMRFYKDIFKSYSDAIEFQYKAYKFIWQFFGNKNKFCTRNSGELLQNDIDLLKETIELLHLDTNMAKYCENGAGYVENLNDYLRNLQNHNGSCRFVFNLEKTGHETYKIVQAPFEQIGGIKAKIEVQKIFKILDSEYYSKVYDCLRALMIILACELINELKAWNTGSIKQKRAHIQKAFYATIQSESGINIILTEALKVFLKA